VQCAYLFLYQRLTIFCLYSIFSEQSYMKPSDVRQYLFALKLKDQYSMLAFTEDASSIGKLDIVWKSSFGERGRLQTSQLQRAVSGKHFLWYFF